MSLERLYQETSNLLQQTHFAMGRLERAKDEREANEISQQITGQLRTIDQNSGQLEILVNKEAPTRRHIVRVKVEQLKADSDSVRYAIAAINSRLTAKWRAISDREELLHQRFQTNESTRLCLEDHELHINDRLKSSNRQVDDLISHGAAVLENLRSQHMNLRGIRKKMLDIGAALGLSSTTLQMIDRRLGEDWLIFLVGCVVTLIFMYVFYRFWRG
ncbi:vesicle transport v-SNARE protein [Dictyocaulus viviparus]|uniref:Vesicle transport v-SNARE protein n=1 Tax=Dictyocaulus viviparus TaxID=29172 RepID=A0A0D8XUT8_DICVI|nr:vesicle transport v-SNARE protein [Dictyocaulus viviparus]